MTTIYLPEDIAKDEGYARALPDGRCEAYPDPLSGAEPWTVGYGTCGPDVTEGVIWTQAQAYARLLTRIGEIEKTLDTAIPWWRDLDPVRQDALINAAFNLGVHGLLGFHDTLAALSAGDWKTAAAELLDSDAARDLPERYGRLAHMLLAGARA